MNPNLSEAIKEAYAVATQDALIETLEILVPGQDPLYIYKGIDPLEMRLESGTWVEFQPVPFGFKLPKNTETGTQTLEVTVDGVSNEVLTFVQNARASAEPVQIKYRPYLGSDLSTPQMSPPLTLFLKGLVVTLTQVVAQGSFVEFVNKKFPNEYYTTERFKGLRG